MQGGCPFPYRKDLTWVSNVAGPVRGSALSPPCLLRMGSKRKSRPSGGCYSSTTTSLNVISSYVAPYWCVSDSVRVINAWARMRNSIHGPSLVYSPSLPPEKQHISYLTDLCDIASRSSSLKHSKSWNQRWKSWFRVTPESGAAVSALRLTSWRPLQMGFHQAPIITRSPNPFCLPPPNLSPTY